MPRAKETEAPPVNEDGPHVIVYVKGDTREVDKFYKEEDPERPGDFLRLSNGKVIVKQCCKHNGGNKLFCVHRKELPKCLWCKKLGVPGGGTSYCIHDVRRELCLTCKGTSAGISKPAMARKTKVGESLSAAPAAVPAPAPAAPPAPAPVAAPELAPPNQLRLCYVNRKEKRLADKTLADKLKETDHGLILLPDLFTKQGPETIETAFVALKRKADDLERENKRLKTADTLGA